MDPTIPTKNAIMFFPQEWDVLINCLPLINYYHNQYINLKVIMRGDAFNMFNFYITQFHNVQPIYLDKSILDVNFKNYIHINDSDKVLFFGGNDFYRNDKYRNYYRFRDTNNRSISKFYTLYDIPYSERIKSFSLKRNNKLENEEFKKVVASYSGEYRVIDSTHSDEETGIKTFKLSDDLNKIFHYIKILETSKEIYLGESNLAYVCYLLDAKYGIFRNIKINLICNEDRSAIFSNPRHLNNWKIKIITND
jgi:hypothetical protein